jgi:hypothetical protein
LPERAAEATGEVRKVDRLGTVRFGSARYSVPSELVGLEVELLVEGDDVHVLHRGAEVALHQSDSCRAAAAYETRCLVVTSNWPFE